MNRQNSKNAPAGNALRLQVHLRDSGRATIEGANAISVLKTLLDTIGGLVMVLNRNRQIMLASRDLLNLLDLDETPTGIRPGEAMGCVHAWESALGCGSTDACTKCGALSAFLQGFQLDRPVQREFLINIRRGRIEEPCEFLIKSHPIAITGEPCTLVTLTDISQQKRRENLESVFFHDIRNTINGLIGWGHVLSRSEGEDRQAAAKRFASLADHLTREINSHRALMLAEAGTLQPTLEGVQPARILETLEGLFATHRVANGKRLEIDKGDTEGEIVTDFSLLVGVLTNMVMNAFEATPAGGLVRVWTRADNNAREFLVWNRKAIPKGIAPQIFLRSFSTKSEKGRGLGTFSMKLFGERYLGGKVRYASSDEEGTVFSLSLPRQGPQPTPS